MSIRRERRSARLPAGSAARGETLRNRVRQAERDRGPRSVPTSAEGERIRALEREYRGLRQANEILQGIGLFCDGGAQIVLA